MRRKRRSWYVKHSNHFLVDSHLKTPCVPSSSSFSLAGLVQIQRRIKFPLELDALDLATDDLKAKLLSASRKVKEVEKERAERRKVRKRTKVAGGASSSTAAAGGPGDVEMSDSTTTATVIASNNEDTTTKDKGKEPIPGGELEDEGIYRAKEAAEFEALVDSSLKNDLGSSTTGLYELVGLCLFCLLSFMPFFWFILKC